MAAGTVIGTFALGPLVAAVAVGIGAGLALDWIDNHYQLTAKLQVWLDQALQKLDNMMHAVAEKTQNLIGAGVNATAKVAHRAVDLAVDAAIGYASRKLNNITWQVLPLM
jgi:hypothetical protein